MHRVAGEHGGPAELPESRLAVTAEIVEQRTVEQQIIARTYIRLPQRPVKVVILQRRVRHLLKVVGIEQIIIHNLHHRRLRIAPYRLHGLAVEAYA